MSSSNFGNAANVKIPAGWAFFKSHKAGSKELSLGYTQGGIQTEIGSETAGVEADQSTTPIITTLSNVTLGITVPMMEWKTDNMLIAFPGAEKRTDAMSNDYVVMTTAPSDLTGTLRIHPTDKDDNDFSGERFYPNVKPSPNISFTQDGTNAQLLTVKFEAGPGSLPFAEKDGDTAYMDYLPAAAIIHPAAVSVMPATETLTVGQTKHLTAALTPADATDNKVTWESSDESVVRVSETGDIYGVSAGAETVTATTRDGALTDDCDVTVS